MKEAAGAVQDLMRDTARLFDQAGKINAQLVQLDAFVCKETAVPLLAGLEQSRTQYKEALARARSLAAAAAAASGSGQAERSDGRLEELETERARLRGESQARSDELRRLLDCMRQVQLTSAQLLQL
ncbi:hypothetical protein IWQ56_005807 [Coemansia nantahalensis]|uniref:Uncharacterized protein n=1 Tax=Coemansia nantahalensis TaxID=2789366 RepID=A0ACC1JNJ4_9FUNG|nr:hypothetical protein IWQ56_005807 [Coemansia nantahalensis]KAJ2764324.1 hypothetical protein IWQ57_005206 [Coemansia nantahalensis]